MGEEEPGEESLPFRNIATDFLWSDTPPLPFCFTVVFCPHLLNSSSQTDLPSVWVIAYSPLDKFLTLFPLASHKLERYKATTTSVALLSSDWGPVVFLPQNHQLDSNNPSPLLKKTQSLTPSQCAGSDFVP